MKKALLLSVVASSMIMAGGDIQPVEPMVETPAPAPAMEETSGWDFSGQIVAFTQTVDESGAGDLFDDDSTYAAWGAQLRAVNKDVFGGIGLGGEITFVESAPGQKAGFYGGGGNAGLDSGGVTQAYLTYGAGPVNLKIGRQTLPKALSPFAYSEGWQMFKNTFDAALAVVGGVIPDTTLVGAYVYHANNSIGNYANEASFGQVNGTDGAFMLTAQNKSIDGLTLTGSYYTANNLIDIFWGDAKFKISNFSVALQGGQIDPNAGTSGTVFGGKVGAKFGPVNLMAAYSKVDDALTGARASNLLGGGVKSPLYTQMVLNNVGQYHANPGAEFIKLGGTMKALGGTIKAFYGMGTNGNNAATDYTELDLMYVTKLTDNIKVFGAYVLTNDDDTATGPKDNNFLRFWARYSF